MYQIKSKPFAIQCLFDKDGGGASGGSSQLESFNQRIQKIEVLVSTDASSAQAKTDLLALRREMANATIDGDSRKIIDSKLSSLESKLGLDAPATAKSLLEQIKILSSPETTKQAIVLFNKERKNYTEIAQREALRGILAFQIFQNHYTLDVSTGMASLRGKNGEKIDATIEEEFKKIPFKEVSYALTSLVAQDIGNMSLASDSVKLADALYKKADIKKTENKKVTIDAVYANSSLSAAEKSWLISYIENPENLKLSSSDSAQMAESAKTNSEHMKSARAKVQSKVDAPIDWRDPMSAIVGIMERGGPMLVIGGGLWLLFTCFGFDTTGEKGSFFMKLLAGAAGIGAAKAVGVVDFIADGLEGKEGTTGGDAINWVKKEFGDATTYLKQTAWAFEFTSYNFTAGGKSEQLLDSGFVTIRDRLNSNGLQDLGAIDDSGAPMDTSKQASLREKSNELYKKGQAAWNALPSQKRPPNFPTYEDFLRKGGNGWQPLSTRELFKFAYAQEVASDKKNNTENVQENPKKEEVLTLIDKKYADGGFLINTRPISRENLKKMVRAKQNADELKDFFNVKIKADSNSEALLSEIKNKINS